MDSFIRKRHHFKGIGQVYSEGVLFDDVIAFYGEAGAKYNIKHIVLIKIENILPLVSPVYDTGVTEQDVIYHSCS